MCICSNIYFKSYQKYWIYVINWRKLCNLILQNLLALHSCFFEEHFERNSCSNKFVWIRKVWVHGENQQYYEKLNKSIRWPLFEEINPRSKLMRLTEIRHWKTSPTLLRNRLDRLIISNDSLRVGKIQVRRYFGFIDNQIMEKNISPTKFHISSNSCQT